jgi:hypothetical protein
MSVFRRFSVGIAWEASKASLREAPKQGSTLVLFWQ